MMMADTVETLGVDLIENYTQEAGSESKKEKVQG